MVTKWSTKCSIVFVNPQVKLRYAQAQTKFGRPGTGFTYSADAVAPSPLVHMTSHCVPVKVHLLAWVTYIWVISEKVAGVCLVKCSLQFHNLLMDLYWCNSKERLLHENDQSEQQEMFKDLIITYNFTTACKFSTWSVNLHMETFNQLIWMVFWGER